MSTNSKKVMEFFLRFIAFSVLCSIMVYMAIVLVAWVMGLVMITQFVFGTMSGSPWNG